MIRNIRELNISPNIRFHNIIVVRQFDVVKKINTRRVILTSLFEPIF